LKFAHEAIPRFSGRRFRTENWARMSLSIQRRKLFPGEMLHRFEPINPANRLQ